MICTVTQPRPAAAAKPAVKTPASTLAALGLVKRFDERLVLDGVSLTAGPGECLALLGANGAGKSTLLRILALLLPPCAGAVTLFGQTAQACSADLRARIGLLGHQSMLYRDLTARENLLFFARLYGVDDPAARAAQMLEHVGLADRADDPVKTFSRGMTQRLAIARTLVHEPRLILADEPFAGLDVASTATLEEMLLALCGQGRTIVLVNHDIEQSLRLAHRVVVLRGGTVAIDAASTRVDKRSVLKELTS